MPKVPVLSTRQVAPNVRAAPNVSPASVPGMGLAAGLSTLAGAVGEMAQKAKDEADAVRLNASEVDAQNEANRIRREALARQGVDAMRGAEDSLADWESSQSAILAKIGDPDVRRRAAERFSILGVGLRNAIENHTADQHDVVAADSAKAIIEDSLATISADPGNAAQVEVNIGRAVSTLADRLRQMGKPSEFIDNEMAKLQSQARLAQVRGLVQAGNIDRAREVIKASDGRRVAVDRIEGEGPDAIAVIQDADTGQTYEIKVSALPESLRREGAVGTIASRRVAVDRIEGEGDNAIAVLEDADLRPLEEGGRAGNNEVFEVPVSQLPPHLRTEGAVGSLAVGKLDLNPGDLATATRMLQVAEQGRSAAEHATRILAASDSPVERNEMIAALPIEMRKGVRDLVRAEQTAEKEARDLEQETAFSQLEQAQANGVPLSDPRLAPLLSLISTTQRQTLDRYAMAPTNDNAAWMEWYQLASDPKELAKLTESEFRAKWSRLSTSHRDDAERDYRRAKGVGEGATPAYVTPQTIVARAMRNLGGIAPFAPLSQIDESKQPMVAQFEMRASEEIAAEATAKGRNLTPSEVQTVVDRMQLQFVRETARTPTSPGDRMLRGTTTREERRAFELSPSDTTGIFAGTTRIRLDQIPADSISGVDNILRANRVPVTDKNREAAYTIQRFDLDGTRLTRWLNANRR